MRDPARLVFPGFRFGQQPVSDAVALARLGVGGFCVYLGTPAKIAALTRAVNKAAGRRLLIAADYEEGGWVHAAGSTPLPTNLAVGASGRPADAREKGLLTALEARAMGVDWVFAPVVDLAGEPRNPIVNLRAFSDRPGPAARLASAYLDGLKAGGALGCLKHFPGHGDVTKDSHLDLPKVTVARSVLDRRELPPFKALAKKAGAVMTAHLLVPALEKRPIPITLSDKGTGLLKKWGFRGIVTTDALDMKAVADRWPEREAALMALRGGAHVMLVPKDPKALVAGLRVEAGRDPGLSPLIDEAYRRLDTALRLTSGRRASLNVVGSRAHRARAAVLFANAVAWKRPLKAAVRSVALYPVVKGSDTKPFVAELKRRGVAVRLSKDGKARKGETLVAVIVSVPRAYSGRINLGPVEKSHLKRTLKGTPGSVAVSLGSPFTLAGLPASSAALCSFSRADEAQRAAARVLAGAERARGSWPIES